MYCILLYWLSRELFQNGKLELADKVYYLNKMLNAVELFYEVKLPAIWSCEHPLGSVMGRADYGDYFFFYQDVRSEVISGGMAKLYTLQ